MFGIGGDVAARTGQRIDQQLIQQLALQQFQQQVEESNRRAEREQKQQELQEKQFARQLANDEEDRLAGGEARARQARLDRGVENKEGARRMIGTFLMQRRPGPLTSSDRLALAALMTETGETPDDSLLNEPVVRRTPVTTIGPKGQPVRRAVTDEELAGGVPEYREPREPKEQTRLWVTRAGKPMRVTESEIQPGDAPFSSGGESAQDRQRGARMQAAKGFLERLDTLRERINTKMGPQAGATGLVRRGAANIGMDPDVAEYERIRAAGGRSLAVAIMGAQNLSDQDANAWAGMLPGATVDRETAKRLTDQVRAMLDNTGGGDAGAMRRPIPGIPGAEAESTDGGRTWRRVK